MTTAARKVLADCEIAFDMLESETRRFEYWRVHWAGAVALVRTVGHVLHNVDRENPVLRPLIDAAYSRWKTNRAANAIFWKFIQKERNNILKEYRFNLDPQESIDVVAMETDQYPEPEIFSLDENLYRPILGDFGEGEDARDIYREALNWWDAELTVIENNP